MSDNFKIEEKPFGLHGLHSNISALYNKGWEWLNILEYIQFLNIPKCNVTYQTYA